MDLIKFKLYYRRPLENTDTEIDLDKIFLKDEDGNSMSIEELLNAISVALNQVDTMAVEVEKLKSRLNV